MLHMRLSMSYFDALVYNKIVGTTIKTSLELHRLSKQMPVSINVINWASSLHVKTLSVLLVG